MTRRLTFLTALAITIGGATPSAAAPACQFEATTPAYEHVRVSDAGLRAQFDEGLKRSATLRSLVARIEKFNALVYIHAGYAGGPAGGWLTGAMSHRVISAGDVRFVHIEVWPNRSYKSVATIGHELQHAIEVLEAGVSGEARVTDLYKRIGVVVRKGVYETTAAQRAGTSVLDDLIRCKG